jgi:hypothetical protein
MLDEYLMLVEPLSKRKSYQIPFFPARYRAYPIAANIIPRNAITGRVAALGTEIREAPQT